ncbi:ankyrin repeat-containing domain protein [Apiospora kogelbergensis]|uniref:ankyrin repeat-containing domain protein n=1 Tax=Apiospora kogelbergensis TaxID=1337665 RepID=UPI003130C2C6
MSIQEAFEEIPRELTTDSLMVPIPNRDANAMTCMLTLSDNLNSQPPGTYARGSWGYTKSDDMFPAAIAKLDVWMRKYHLHIHRFPMWGEKGEAQHQKKANGSINDELGRRFRVELLEDKDRLDLPHLNRAAHDDICFLCDVFDTWVARVGQDPPLAETSISPRFCDCLVVDDEALRSLAALPEDPPQLHVAADCATKQVRYTAYRDGMFRTFRLPQEQKWRGDASAFLWLLDTRSVRRFAPDPDQFPTFRGWMKLNVGEIPDVWFQRCSRIGGGGDWILECRKGGDDTYWWQNG